MTRPAAGRVRTEVVSLTRCRTDIRIGAGVRAALWDAVRERHPRARCAHVVVDEHVQSIWPLHDPAAAAGFDVRTHAVPRGEAAKTRDVLATLQDGLLDLRRDEPVIVQGGGAALDVGGFAAATVRRGLPWVAVATTVVAMADAAIGGKVAVNHPRGKNLLGTFHPPALVLSDVDTLATLEPRERLAGLAEVYKSARVGDGDLLARLRAGPPAGPEDWTEVIARAAAVKARLVERDERDLGQRRLLNYGHTFGHALETVLGNEVLRHGEAVAVGMHLAARVAAARGLISASDVAEQASDLTRLGLPTAVPAGREAAVLACMDVDKKRRAGARHTLVLPTGPCEVRVFEDVRAQELAAVLGSAS